jgi:uncharacterized protein YjbI with pentapeptide repeats
MSDKSLVPSQNSGLRLQVNWREAFKASAKLLVDFLFKNYNSVGTDVIDFSVSMGWQKQVTPESLAALLINRALIGSMVEIIREYCEDWQDLSVDEQNRLTNHLLSQTIFTTDTEFEVDIGFFEQPRTFNGLSEAKRWMEEWLTPLVTTERAKAMSARLPTYFTCALHDELLQERDRYQILTNYFTNTLTLEAYKKEMGWRRYTAWLDKQLDEPIFAETFGIRPLYVPLCAHYINRHGQDILNPSTRDRNKDRQIQNTLHAQDLESAMDIWLKDDNAPVIRLISGGPGSGKSTFTRWWAARVAERGEFKVWHIALNYLNFTGDLEGKLKDLAAKNPYLVGNPLEEPNLLLIFDGLDELSLSGQVGFIAAENFIDQLITLVRSIFQPLKVLISGRDAIIKSQINKFSKPDQIWDLLPYFISEDKRKQYQSGSEDVLRKDRRDDWWKKYGTLKNINYDKLPDNLRLERLEEITAQPILNYLLAISEYFLNDRIGADTTRNEIYQSLLERVYERGWEKSDKATGNSRHGSTREIKSFSDFQLILEEVGLCSWHGDGRKVTEREVIAHCDSENSSKKVKNLFSCFVEQLQHSQEAKITKLMTAFYFQELGERGNDGEKAFEFTHKSFGEFLTAKRLVKTIDKIDRKYCDDEDGWNERTALKVWAEVCKSGVLNLDILEFFRQEIRLFYQDEPNRVSGWQQTICKLITYLLRHGLPMEDFGLPFYEMNKRAIQSEITILAALNACARCTGIVSNIGWEDRKTFGTWLARMQGQRDYRESSLVVTCLGWLSLEQANLVGANLEGANLEGANLEGANLERANLVRANLERVNLKKVRLVGASLVETRLDESSLNEAILDRSSLDGARLDGARLDGASLERSSLVGARLNGVILDGARLDGAILDGASLDGASLDGARLVGARLDRVSLKGARLVGASLIGARLEGAILDGARLDGTLFRRASLGRANLSNIVWNQYTHWQNVQDLESAYNVPEELQQYYRSDR